MVGAGIMGAGIAGAHVRRGVPALMLDSVPAALEKGVANIAKIAAGPRRDRPHEAGGSAGRPDPAEYHQQHDNAGRPRRRHRGGRRERSGQDAALSANCRTFFPTDAILASNTSTISITRMAQAVEEAREFRGHALLQPGRSHAAGGGDPRRDRPAMPPWRRWWRWPSTSARRRSWSAIAPVFW